MTKEVDAPQELSDEDLDDANGGGLLLPAVQQRLGREKVISPSSGPTTLSSGQSDGDAEYRPKPVIVTSFSTSGSAD